MYILPFLGLNQSINQSISLWMALVSSHTGAEFWPRWQWSGDRDTRRCYSTWKKQKIWFDVLQDVHNPVHDEGVESSGSLTDIPIPDWKCGIWKLSCWWESAKSNSVPWFWSVHVMPCSRVQSKSRCPIAFRTATIHGTCICLLERRTLKLRTGPSYQTQ